MKTSVPLLLVLLLMALTIPITSGSGVFTDSIPATLPSRYYRIVVP